MRIVTEATVLIGIACCILRNTRPALSIATNIGAAVPSGLAASIFLATRCTRFKTTFLSSSSEWIRWSWRYAYCWQHSTEACVWSFDVNLSRRHGRDGDDCKKRLMNDLHGCWRRPTDLTETTRMLDARVRSGEHVSTNGTYCTYSNERWRTKTIAKFCGEVSGRRDCRLRAARHEQRGVRRKTSEEFESEGRTAKEEKGPWLSERRSACADATSRFLVEHALGWTTIDLSVKTLTAVDRCSS